MAAVIVTGTFAFWAVLRDAAFWKIIATTPEPECCSFCEEGNGMRHQAPVLLDLSSGEMWELEIYDSDPTKPWEVAAEQHWDDWVFCFLDNNATMSWSSKDHTNITTIVEKSGQLNPAHFCHDCRALLAEMDSEGYVLLDLYDLEDIRAFAIEDGVEYTIRDYTVSIYPVEGMGGLSVEVTGHLFGTE